MRAGVVTFPGSNCDRDLRVAMELVLGRPVRKIWHTETELGDLDLVGVPGGFAFGDYLRCGAVAARSPVMREVGRLAGRGTAVLGICNGFQILCEAGLLPGALLRNRELAFLCKPVQVEVATRQSYFTDGYRQGQALTLPIAHHDGCYVVDEDELARLRDQDRVAFRYTDEVNGSTDRIAGILSERRNVLGMMPHPERACDPVTGFTDGRPLFESLMAALV